METTQISVDKRLINSIKDFDDVQTIINIALQKYLIERITAKISDLSQKNKFYQHKFETDYDNFVAKVSTDTMFIDFIENKKGIKTWENDLLEWEFCKKGIMEWNQKLQNILMM